MFTPYLTAGGEEKAGEAKFFQTIEDGDIETVKTLIQSGTDVNAQDKESGTALMWAAFLGHSEIVRFLLQTGAEVNAKTTDGTTALMAAAKSGHTELVRLLLQAGVQGGLDLLRRVLDLSLCQSRFQFPLQQEGQKTEHKMPLNMLFGPQKDRSCLDRGCDGPKGFLNTPQLPVLSDSLHRISVRTRALQSCKTIKTGSLFDPVLIQHEALLILFSPLSMDVTGETRAK